jgi:hypothetical protein
MGRNNTPTAILDARGTFLKHPEYERLNEPQGSALSKTPPKDFTIEQKKLWKELMRMLAPGVAQSSDLWALRHLVMLEAKSRDPNINFKDCEHRLLLSYLDIFGLSPAARSKVSVPAAPKSKLATFLSQPQAKQPSAVPIPILLPSPDSLPN